MRKTRMILLEFNELCPSLIHRFMTAGQLPAFQRLYGESLVYITRAQERPPYLDPWIQWLTVHTGLNFAEHGIDKLNEGHRCTAPRIWDVVSEHGGTSWICGSMSASYRPGFKGALVPDPWTTKVPPTPRSFAPYFTFVQGRVLESTNSQASLSGSEAASFLRFMAVHGLSAATVAAVARQMLTERRGAHQWKRAVILDLLQFDVFRHYWKSARPTFSTLFLNSTAHFQHLHWREMEPHLFQVQPSTADRAKYESAILFGYQQMDLLLGRVLEMIDERTTVVLASALSQQPCLRYEDQGGKAFYRPRSFERLFEFAGVREWTAVAPVMAHQFHVEFASAEAARLAVDFLEAIRVGDRRALAVERQGAQVFAWCAITSSLNSSARLDTRLAGVVRSQDFFSVFYQVDGIKSGMHHPDGLLWIRRASLAHCCFDEPVALDLVAPTLLTELGIAPPTTMRHETIRTVAPRRSRAGRASAGTRQRLSA